MSKEQSTILKGVAILMMLWFHLFNTSELEQLCSPLIYIHGKALVAYLANACYPVTFFLIFSGYGLTYLYKEGTLTVKSQSKRLLRLYIHYWVILLIFVPIGHFINPAIYPNDFQHILENITAIKCNYNGEIWFLFPYAVICLAAVFNVDFLYCLKGKANIALVIVIYALLFGFMKYISVHLPENIMLNMLALQFIYYVILMFYFSLGIILFRVLEKGTPVSNIKPSVCTLLIVCLVIIKSMFHTTLFDGVYAFLFILLFIQLPLNSHINKVLTLLGRYSMPMWMVHTFYSYYFCKQFIYGFKYPLLIFAVLIIVSYLTAIPIMYISHQIIKHCKI